MASLIPKFKKSGELLNHILDLAELPAIIQSLDASILTKLIRHVGLEDSAQIISVATAEQLKGVLDQDLWHSESPGQDEIFDAERFSQWLEIMMENGPPFVIRKLIEMDENLVTLGLCRLVLVVGINDPGPQLGKVLDSSLNQEFGNYVVIAKNDSGWDTVCALLAELNESDYEMLIRLLDRCCRITGEFIENNGDLYHVLTSDEMLEEDVSSERKERREGMGFVTPTSAAAFLGRARSVAIKEIMTAKTMDPYTTAYFEAVERKTEPVFRSQGAAEKPGINVSEINDPKVRRFIQILENAEVLMASDLKMIGYCGAESGKHHLPLANSMRQINQTQPDLYYQRINELSYLSNTLISGCRFQGHAFKPKEAIEAAFSVCNLGSEYLIETDIGLKKKQSYDRLTVLLKENNLIKLFQVGWKILFDDVVLLTAKAVLEFIGLLKEGMEDPEQACEVTRMVNMLRFHILSKRPWEFNSQLDYLQLNLDNATIMTVAELLREYPTLSETICKKGGHRVSPFIWSQLHIMTVRRFLKDEL